MKKPKNWFKTNVAYGLVVVVPLAVLVLLFAKLVEVLQTVASMASCASSRIRWRQLAAPP